MRKLILLIVLSLIPVGYATSFSDILDPPGDGRWYSSDFNTEILFFNSNGLGYNSCYYFVQKQTGSNTWETTKSKTIDCSGGTDWTDTYKVTVGSSNNCLDNDGQTACHCPIQGSGKCRIGAQIIGQSPVYRYINIDYSEPSSSISPYGYSGPSDVTFTVSCFDSYSGCKENHYEITRTSGSIIVPHTVGNSYTLACDSGSACTYIVHYHSKDNVGNENYFENKQFFIDKRPPEPIPAQMASLTMYSTSATTYSNNANDPSGVTYIFSGNGQTKETRSNNAGFGGLMPDTNYCFTVRYKDDYGNMGSDSSALCGYTKLQNPYINNLVATSSSSIRVYINSNGNPSHVQYKIYYERSDGLESGETEWFYGTEYEIGGLGKVNALYKFRVKASGHSGETSWSSFSNRYTLANSVSNLDIDSSFDLLSNPQGFIGSLSNLANNVITPYMVVESCSPTPIKMYDNGTVEYSIGIKTGEVFSRDVMNISLCGNEYYHIEGSEETPLSTGLGLRTGCQPYDAYYDIPSKTIIIQKRNYKFDYVPDLIVTNLDDLQYDECESEVINIPNPVCTNPLAISNGYIAYNLGINFEYEDMKFNCVSGTLPIKAFPIETPCYPTGIAQLDDNDIVLLMSKTVINGINPSAVDPLNPLDAVNVFSTETKSCENVPSISQERVYTFEDGQLPPGWKSYLFDHSFYPIDSFSSSITSFDIDECNSLGLTLSDILNRITGQNPSDDLIEIKDGWRATYGHGYNSNYGLKTQITKGYQTAYLVIPIIVTENSKVQFNYISDFYIATSSVMDAKFRISVNGKPISGHGLLDFGIWIENADVVERVFRFNQHIRPSYTGWGMLDSISSTYTDNSPINLQLSPGLNIITLEFTTTRNAECDAINTRLDNFKVVPI